MLGFLKMCFLEIEFCFINERGGGIERELFMIRGNG